jgi:leader peptidase (prepilin peptidase)/N-methyltransferase
MELIYTCAIGIVLGLISSIMAIGLPVLIDNIYRIETSEHNHVPVSKYSEINRNFSGEITAARYQILFLALVSATITIWTVSREGWTWHSLVLLLFFSAALSVGLADWRSRLIPDALTLPLLWIGMLIQLLPATRTVGIESSVIGAALGYMLPWTLGVISSVIGRKDSVGGGDLKFIAMIGSWLGPMAALWVLFAASLGVVLAYAIMRLVDQGDKSKMAAFGPWLAAAAIGWVLIGM